MSKESWVDIAGYDGSHQVSSWGRVRSIDRLNARGQLIGGKVFCAKPGYDGHVTAGICKDAKKTRYGVNRLVAKMFIPNPDGLPEVGHVDGNRSNNRVENLYWTDHGDFIDAGYACGSRIVAGSAGLVGQDSPSAKLTNASVYEIREFDGTHAQAAKAFGVSRSLAQKVRRGVNCPHVCAP